MGYDFTGMTAEDLRAEAARCRRSAAESYERCQEDGFLTQAASSASAEVYDLQAQIVENGGRDLFLTLFDTEGNIVPALYVDSDFGHRQKVWKVYADPQCRGRVVTWFTPSKAKTEGVARRNDAKRGYYIGYAEFPAVADMGASGVSWYPIARRVDDRDFRDGIPVDNGHLPCEDAERWYRVQDGRFDRGE